MKRYFTLLLMLPAALFIMLNTGCKKEEDDDNGSSTPTPTDTSTVDSIPPVITLNGNSAVLITLNSSYTDAGATANDAHDGTVTVTSNASATNPNIDSAGVYTIIYTAQDSTGNSSQLTRTVTVRNDAYYLEGTYACLENGVDNFMQSISASTTTNNRIIFSKFANYINNSSIAAIVIGTSISLPLQTALNIGTIGCDHVFNQMGPTTITIVSSKASFVITFSDKQLSGGVSCPATNPVTYSDSFVQQ